MYIKTTLLGREIIEYAPHKRTIIVSRKCDRQYIVLPYLFFAFGRRRLQTKTLAMLFSNKPASELTKEDCVYRPLISNIDYGLCGVCLGRSVKRFSLERAVSVLWCTRWSYGAMITVYYDRNWPKRTFSKKLPKWRNATLESVIKIPWDRFRWDGFRQGAATNGWPKIKLNSLDANFYCKHN